jgi:hypothetical protein
MHRSSGSLRVSRQARFELVLPSPLTGLYRARGGGSDDGAAVVTELFRDWATPLADPAREVIYWYFNEIPKHTDQVGVADAEKAAAAAQGVH